MFYISFLLDVSTILNWMRCCYREWRCWYWQLAVWSSGSRWGWKSAMY